jgi:preprotein translocase subunit Sss1
MLEQQYDISGAIVFWSLQPTPYQKVKDIFDRLGLSGCVPNPRTDQSALYRIVPAATFFARPPLRFLSALYNLQNMRGGPTPEEIEAYKTATRILWGIILVGIIGFVLFLWLAGLLPEILQLLAR